MIIAARPKPRWIARSARLPFSPQLGMLIGVIVAWSALHWGFREVLIFHDAWKHNFPEVYGAARNSACGQFAHWLMSPDTGSPTVIYAISISLTQPIRALLMHWWACSQPQPFDAMLLYKLQIFVIYLGFALGMFVLGRVLFRHWLSAAYLAAATLFSGFCVDSVHADQAVVMVFWVPWCAAAMAMADRHAGERRGALYVNLAALFFSLELLDQSPHLASLAAVCAASIYGAMRFERLCGILRQWRRLWPAALVLLVSAADLYVIHSRIYEYLPSQRVAITVHPSQFGQTGFIQPSAFFGAFFPLTFTAAFEEIASGYGWRAFIYRLDVTALYVGTLPLLLVFSLFPRGGLRGSPLGWLVFSIVMVLISLQTSRLYLVLFHLPFFDLFRDYFHYFVYAVVGLLVVSGHGFDRLMYAARAERAAVLRSTLVVATAVFVAGAVALAGVAYYGQGHGPGLWSYVRPIAEDAVILLVAFGLWAAAAWYPNFRARHAALAIMALMVTQSIHAAGIYRQLGEPAHAAFDRYRMDEAMLRPYSAAEWADPARIKRVPCPTNASCHLAQRDAASVRRDLEGSFFRHRLNPVFQDSLSPDIKAALVGITHPVLWASAGLRPVPSVAALNAELEAHRGDLRGQLSRATYLIGATSAESSPTQPLVSFADMTRGADGLAFRYRADRAAVANLLLTAAPGWQASINGIPTPIVSGNLGTIAVRLPAGEGEVALQYDDPASRYFFWSRWLLAALGFGGAALLARRSGSPEAPSPSRRPAFFRQPASVATVLPQRQLHREETS